MPSSTVLVILLVVALGLAAIAVVYRRHAQRQAQLKRLVNYIFIYDFSAARPLWLALGCPDEKMLVKYFSAAITDPGNTALWLRMQGSTQAFFVSLKEQRNLETIQPFTAL